MSAPDGIRFKSNDMRHMSLNALLNKAVNDYIRAIEHICEHDALEKCSSILERHGWVRCDVNIDQLKAENAKLREENERFIIKLNAEHIVRQNIEVENTKLRDYLERKRHLQDFARLVSENARLREACAELLKMAERHDPEWLHWPEIHEELRELGVEVDG